jgi:flavin-binding protein dodecin
VSPREIRGALLPEEVGEFDSAWRGALARAADSLDLAEVHEVLRRWHRSARLTHADQATHRRMLAVAARVQTGGAIPTVPLSVVESLIRNRLAQ